VGIFPKAELEVGWTVPVLFPEIIIPEGAVFAEVPVAGVAFFGTVGFFILL
jgi:hypothetical protein